MRFRTTILQTGRTACGIQVPDAVVEGLGAGKRPPVRVTIHGHTYRSSVAVMGGVFMVGVSAENRAGAGVAALDAEPDARHTFDDLSYSNKSWHVLSIEGARTAETRQRRIHQSVSTLREGRPR